MENIFPTKKYHFFFVCKTMTWVNFFFFKQPLLLQGYFPQFKYLKDKEFSS